MIDEEPLTERSPRIIDPYKERPIVRYRDTDLVLRPVTIRYQDKLQLDELGCLASYADIQTYIRPLHWYSWAAMPLPFLKEAYQLGSADFRRLIKMAYTLRMGIKIGANGVHQLGFKDYKKLFEREFGPQDARSAIVIDDWGKSGSE